MRAISFHRPDLRQIGAVLAGWRGLGRFWAGVIVAFLLLVILLQTLGPPRRMAASSAPEEPIAEAEPVQAAPAHQKAKENAPPKPPAGMAARSLRPGRDTPGPIPDPDPALLVSYAAEPSMKLPRISVDGRVPMAVYASGFDPSSVRPRVGLLIAGIGMSEGESLAAIKDLPEGITFAVSPYATNMSRVLEAMRMTGHEYLLSIPMEPAGYPVNDPDDRRALMTALPPLDNQNRLTWLLSRFNGYVGVTNAFGQMHGERLSAVADQLGAVLEDISRRGLLFVDDRVGQPNKALAWNRSVDLQIDDDEPDAAGLDERLDQLSHLALDRGSALGLVSLPRPLTLARVAAWTTTLTAKGLALAPVSALVTPPHREGTPEALQTREPKK